MPEKRNNPGKYDLDLTRELDAPRELVFKAWTDPAQIAQWWGPDHFRTIVRTFDATPGGKILMEMRGPDKSVYPMSGTVREIVPPERIVMTTAALDANGKPMFETQVTVTLEAHGNKTTLKLQARVLEEGPMAAQYLQGMSAGWTQTLGRLATYVTTSDREIITIRDYDAPREMVFDAFADPKALEQWWGPDGFTITTESMTFKPGGSWLVVLHGPDGRDYDNKIVYEEIVRPERITWRHSGDAAAVSFQHSVVLEELGERKTRLTMRAVFESAADRDRVAREYQAVEGGRQTLGRLAVYLSRK